MHLETDTKLRHLHLSHIYAAIILRDRNTQSQSGRPLRHSYFLYTADKQEVTMELQDRSHPVGRMMLLSLYISAPLSSHTTLSSLLLFSFISAFRLYSSVTTDILLPLLALFLRLNHLLPPCAHTLVVFFFRSSLPLHAWLLPLNWLFIQMPKVSRAHSMMPSHPLPTIMPHITRGNDTIDTLHTIRFCDN